MILLGGDNVSKISSGRKVTYYIGLGMIILGAIFFFSVFFSTVSLINNPSMGSGVPPFANAVVGMILVIAGSVVMKIGARGTAGSGLLLDPEKAREDLKPYNEVKGEMINDVISNIDVVDKITKPHEEKEVIKIRCKSCGSLNDEDAKFCKGCGKEL